MNESPEQTGTQFRPFRDDEDPLLYATLTGNVYVLNGTPVRPVEPPEHAGPRVVSRATRLELNGTNLTRYIRHEPQPQGMAPIDWIARALEMPADSKSRGTAIIAGKPYHWVAGGGLKLRAGESPW